MRFVKLINLYIFNISSFPSFSLYFVSDFRVMRTAGFFTNEFIVLVDFDMVYVRISFRVLTKNNECAER